MAKIGQRIVRGVINGMTIGLFGGFGGYILTVALNTLAASTILNPIAVALFFIGGCILSGVGIELSKDMDERGQ